MSDDGAGLHVRQSPRKRAGELSVADFTMLVRVPGQPAAVRVFTDDERDEADRYAAAWGSCCPAAAFAAIWLHPWYRRDSDAGRRRPGTDLIGDVRVCLLGAAVPQMPGRPGRHRGSA